MTNGQTRDVKSIVIIEQRPTGPRVRYSLPEHTADERVQAYVERVQVNGNPVVVSTITHNR